jgi:hypothetical protein
MLLLLLLVVFLQDTQSAQHAAGSQLQLLKSTLN